MNIQNPVLIARVVIYKLLTACGFTILNQNRFYLAAGAPLLLLNNDSLPFVYVRTGDISCCTHYIDSNSRLRNGFTIHQPKRMKEGGNLLARLRDISSLAAEGVHIRWLIASIYKLSTTFHSTLPIALKVLYSLTL